MATQPPKYPNNLRRAIKETGWKLYQLALETQIPEPTLKDYSAGRSPIPKERLGAIALCLDLPQSYLVPRLHQARASTQSRAEQGQEEAAIQRLQTSYQAHPQDENALRELMIRLGENGRYDEAEACYAKHIKSLQSYTTQGPHPSTNAILAYLREERATNAASLAPEKTGQASPTNENIASERATHTFEASVPQKRDELSPPLPSPSEPPTHACSGQNASPSSPVEPTPRSDNGTPTPPPHPNPHTTGHHRDPIVIQTSHVQIVVQPFPDQTSQVRTTPSVLVTPSMFLDPMTQIGGPASASSDQTIPPPSPSDNPQGILIAGAQANIPKLDVNNLRGCHLVSSTDIVPSLKIYGSLCQEQLTTCQQQVDIYETIEQRGTMSDEHIRDLSQITRRDLFTLVSVSSSLLLNMRRGWPPAGILEEFLSEVTASVTTCWYLFRSGGLTLVEYAVPQYLPELEELVKSSSLHRKRAAYLAAQGFLLSSLVSLHRTRHAERVANCQKAVTYASASGDLALLVKSLDNLGDAFLINGQPEESLNTYLQAEHYSKNTKISGFLRSQVLAQLSQPYAKQGNDQEVARCLGEAYATFTEADSETPVFLLTDNGRDQIILYEGSSILELGNHAKDHNNASGAQKYYMDAAEKFDKMERLPSGLKVPVRIAAQILIAQALAEALARNMEGFLIAFEKGAKLAKELGSEKRKQEAREALRAALEQWPNDQRITGLWELLI